MKTIAVILLIVYVAALLPALLMTIAQSVYRTPLFQKYGWFMFWVNWLFYPIYAFKKVLGLW